MGPNTVAMVLVLVSISVLSVALWNSLVADVHACFSYEPSTSIDCGEVIRFTNCSVGGGILLWDFGDGHSSLSQSPAHAYSGPGSYTVTLVAIGSRGQISSRNEVLVISPTPPDELDPVRSD